MKICIDPGHGGHKDGAAKDEAVEDEIALWWAHTLKERFNAHGHEVMLTRSDDTHVDLLDRAQQANRWGADCFLSLHANASSSPAAEGVWVIFPKPSSIGRDLAGRVFDFMRKISGVEDKDPAAEVYPDVPPHVNYNGLTVLRKTTMPAVLIELGFLTNREDLLELRDPEFRRKVCLEIVYAVEDWGKVYGLYSFPEVDLPEKLPWPTPERFYNHIAPVMMDVDIESLPRPEADGLRVAVMKFLNRNVTEENTDWAIEQVKPLLPWAPITAWALDQTLPGVVLEIINRMLGKKTNE